VGCHVARAGVVKAGVAVVVVVACTLLPLPAGAQTGRVALDTVVSIDGAAGSTVPRAVGLWFDVFTAVRVRDGLDLIARPVVSRRTFNGTWQKQIYQLGVKYERPLGRAGTGQDPIGLRIEAGQMQSPIGLAMLENRQDLNPVVSQHSAYYLPLPRVDPDIPQVFLIGGIYPLGAQVTVATRSWDTRVAVIDASPVRGRPFFGRNKPPRMANWVAGFGVTPTIGLRLGAAVAYGPYARASDVSDPRTGDRTARVLQAEAEWSFGYTRIAGEVILSSLETARATSAEARGTWVELTRTLHPRVFVAGRGDFQRYGYSSRDGERLSQTYHRYEAIAGYRFTPNLTARAGYLTRKGYVVFHWDDQIVASLTFQKRFF
jgi:hypothetical protein